MGIQIEGYTFAGPYYHTKTFKEDFPCVYILLNKLNQVVDVGQTDSINTRIINHERKTCWIRNGCGETGLYVCINSDENIRRLLENFIRAKYKPVCGER